MIISGQKLISLKLILTLKLPTFFWTSVWKRGDNRELKYRNSKPRAIRWLKIRIEK